jgi:hypothetical protein
MPTATVEMLPTAKGRCSLSTVVAQAEQNAACELRSLALHETHDGGLSQSPSWAKTMLMSMTMQSAGSQLQLRAPAANLPLNPLRTRPGCPLLERDPGSIHESQQLVHRRLVGRSEHVLVELVARHPSVVLDVGWARLAVNEPAAV